MAYMARAHIKSHLQESNLPPPFCITYCPPPSALRIAGKTGSADVLADGEIRLARLKYSTDQRILNRKLADAPEELFRRCREGLKVTYAVTITDATSNAPPMSLAPTSEPPTQTVAAATTPPDTITPLLPLDTLERRVAETCAADLARMQTLPSMYKNYRNFMLIHGGRGRDEPRNLRSHEVGL